MKKDGLENVRKEPVMVPKWVRGRESLDLVEPVRQPLPMLGLGNSVGTPAAGIEGDVIVVKDFDELDGHAPRTSRAASSCSTRRSRPTADGRVSARRAVARGGARRHRGADPLGRPDRTSHAAHRRDASTPTTLPKIPAAAISAEDADRFQRLQARGVRIRVKLSMEAHFEPTRSPTTSSANCAAASCPNEIVVVGGHFDSWDVGTGASDDAGGCIVTWEALRLMKKLGLRPRRTVRVVLFTNEENGLRGGNAYRDAHGPSWRTTSLLLESDGGVFDPAGFGFTGPGRRRAPTVTAIGSLLKGLGASHDRALRRRRRHRPGRRGRQDPDDVAQRQGRLLPHPPHAGRHDRAHHAEADVGQRRGDRGDGLRHRGSRTG